jgi:hypothetical protein
MHTVSHIVREFFERYERSRNTMDAGLIDEQYPDAATKPIAIVKATEARPSGGVAQKSST